MVAPHPAQGHAEYAESESGPWTLTSNKRNESVGTGGDRLFIGSENYAGVPVLQHLIPERTYYARFVAEDEVGQVQTIVKFTTTPISKPEIIKKQRRWAKLTMLDCSARRHRIRIALSLRSRRMVL